MYITQFEQEYVALEGSRKHSIHKEPVWKIPWYLRGSHKGQKEPMAACTCICAVMPCLGRIIDSVLRNRGQRPYDMGPV